MSYTTSAIQKVTIPINLANLGNTDQSATSGYVSQALLAAPGNAVGNPAAKIFYKSFQSLFDLNPDEIISFVQAVIVKKKASPTITASSITQQLRISKAIVTAGLETNAPTITQASEAILAQLTTTNANIAKLEAGVVSNKDYDASIGLKVGEVNGLFSDTNLASAAALVIYNSVVTAEANTAVLTGTVDIDIYYRKSARN